MTSRLRFILVLMTAASVPSALAAQPQTAWEQALQVCMIAGQDFCTGYFMGAFHTLHDVHMICPNKWPMDAQERLQLVNGYFAEHPTEHYQGLSDYVRIAAMATYPCPKE